MLKKMKTNTHLKPGQKGTKRLLEQYGDKLPCDRYRYDEKRQMRLKTIELIVSETPCSPQTPIYSLPRTHGYPDLPEELEIL